jgi:hypothetical protein
MANKQSGHIFILTHASLFLWWELLPHFSVPNFHSSTATKVSNFEMLELIQDKFCCPWTLVVLSTQHSNLFPYSARKSHWPYRWADRMVLGRDRHHIRFEHGRNTRMKGNEVNIMYEKGSGRNKGHSRSIEVLVYIIQTERCNFSWPIALLHQRHNYVAIHSETQPRI